MKHIRILPVTILAMVLVFGLKLGNFWSDTRDNFLSIEVANVEAKEDKEEAKAETKTEDNTAPEEKAAEKADPAEPATESETGNESVDVTNLSTSEIEVLQRLVERRDQLKKRSDELDLRGKSPDGHRATDRHENCQAERNRGHHPGFAQKI